MKTIVTMAGKGSYCEVSSGMLRVSSGKTGTHLYPQDQHATRNAVTSREGFIVPPHLAASSSYATTGTAPAPSRSGYLPLLDGLRGLAILLVLFHHFIYYNGTGILAGPIKLLQETGWIGVDLFFVLSGFLITGILCDTKDHRGYFRNFYVRRVLRIFPLYYAYLIGFILLLLGALKLYGPNIKLAQALSDSYWALAYLLNFRIVSENHFLNQGINHFWTLAIEEQFYLLWPFFIYFANRTRALQLCLLLIPLAALLRWLLPAVGVSEFANHVLMPCRVDSLAFGALLALLRRSEDGLTPLVCWARYLFPTGLVLLALGYGRAATLSQCGNLLYSLVALTFAALLVLVIEAPPGSFYARIFGNGALRTLGKYAYGIYVFNQLVAFTPGVDKNAWHARLVGLVNFQLVATAIHLILGIGASCALAWLSWHCFEKHFLKLKDKFA
jgi:peptidoglycan/LPS O-acetylase OafA/YrhL